MTCCRKNINTVVECDGCGTDNTVRHREGSDPIMSTRRLGIKCTNCYESQFILKE